MPLTHLILTLLCQPRRSGEVIASFWTCEREGTKRGPMSPWRACHGVTQILARQSTSLNRYVMSGVWNTDRVENGAFPTYSTADRTCLRNATYWPM